MVSDVSPTNEAFLTDAIARGLFKDRRSALDEAVELLRRKQEILNRIESGTQQLRSGDIARSMRKGSGPLARRSSEKGDSGAALSHDHGRVSTFQTSASGLGGDLGFLGNSQSDRR